MDNNQTHKRTHRFVAVELNNLIAMPPKRKLHTCDLQQCCRNLLQRLLFAAESKGKQYSDVIKQILLEAQISIPDRTRRRYLKKARTGQLAVDYSFNSGRPPKLTLDHELLVVGFISDAINRRKPVNNVAVQSFIEQRFGESPFSQTSYSDHQQARLFFPKNNFQGWWIFRARARSCNCVL